MASRQSFWLVFDNFLTSFYQLPDGIHCIWPIKMQGLWEGELPIVGKWTWCLTTLSAPCPALFWLASLKESHQKVAKKMSQSCRKLTKLIKTFVGRPLPDTVSSVSSRKYPYLHHRRDFSKTPPPPPPLWKFQLKLLQFSLVFETPSPQEFLIPSVGGGGGGKKEYGDIFIAVEMRWSSG